MAYEGPIVETVNGGTGLNASGASGNVLTSDGTNWTSAASPTPIGALQYFANAGGDAYLAPNWLKCDGSIVSQATYPTLFTRVGLLNPGAYLWSWKSNFNNNTTTLSTGTLGFGNGKFVLGTTSGSIYTSTNGSSWALQTSNTTSSIRAISYGTIYFAAASPAIITSTDAVSWTVQTSGTSSQVSALAYGNSTYVYLGTNTIASSTDAVTWTQRALPTSTGILDATFGNNLFMGVSGQNAVTSTDGITWRTSQPSYANLSYLNSILVGVNNPVIGTSTDFISYTGRTNPTTSTLLGLSYGVSTYVAVGSSGVALTSTDAITWVSRTSGTASTLSSVVFGTIFISGGSGGVLLSSTDGITWAAKTSGTTSSIQSLSYASGYTDKYCYAGNGGVLRSSTDGTTWTSRTSGTTSSIFCLVEGNNLTVYGTISGGISTSTDHITWNAKTSNTTSNITGLAYGNSTYVCVGGGALLASSTDATTWVVRNPPISNSSGAPISTAINNVTFNSSNNTFYASTANAVLSSTDGTTWNFVQNYIGGNQATITFKNNIFYITSDVGIVFTTTDGVSFSRIATVFVNNAKFSFNSISFGNGNFTGIGTVGGVLEALSSTDAITWNNHTMLNNYGTISIGPTVTRSLTYGNNQFMNANTIGDTFSSNDNYSYNTSTQFQLPLDLNIAAPNIINGYITYQNSANFSKSLYIKAL